MSLFLALTIRAGRITPYQEIVQPIASLSILPYVFLQRYQRLRLISANVLVLFRNSVESVNYSLWVNHSLLILHIYYSQSRMGQPSLMVLFLFLDQVAELLNWRTINGKAFTTQRRILLFVHGSFSLPAAAGTCMKNSQSPKFSKKV